VEATGEERGLSITHASEEGKKKRKGTSISAKKREGGQDTHPLRRREGRGPWLFVYHVHERKVKKGRRSIFISNHG